MGGHGGLNILPQKKWNVYNYDNRAIVERDKKEAAEKKKAEKEKQRENQLQNKIEVLKGDQPGEKEQKHSLITQELKKIGEGNKHINLFEREQQIIENREIVQIKRIQEEEFLKGKDMDYSTKFLGTYANDEKQPWYAKRKGQNQKKKSKHERKEVKREKSRSRSREKKTKKEERSQMEILREKRLKREEKQRKKAQALKKSMI